MGLGTRQFVLLGTLRKILKNSLNYQCAYKRCDGESRSRDFVVGKSTEVLAEIIQILRTNLGCDYITSNPQCDAVRVWLRFYHVNTGPRIFYDTILKVNL
jgi:hypothetical protein